MQKKTYLLLQHMIKTTAGFHLCVILGVIMLNK